MIIDAVFQETEERINAEFGVVSVVSNSGGDIDESALDEIIAIQDELLNGGGVECEDKLEQIAENTPLVYEAGKLAILEDSKYMNGTASGELVTLNDVSPVEHTVGVSVAKKNFANLGTSPVYKRFTNIVEQTRDTIKLEYTANNIKWCPAVYTVDGLVEGETYTVSGVWEMSNSSSQGALRVQWTNDSGATLGSLGGYVNISGKSSTFTVTPKPDGATRLCLFLYAAADSTNSVAGDTITYSNIQIEKGTVATPYTPYLADTSAAKIQVLGKNLLPFPYKDGNKVYNGIAWTVNDDGTITANGTANGDSFFLLVDTPQYTATNGIPYCVASGCPSGGSADTYHILSVMTGHKDIGNGLGISATPSYFRFRIIIKSGYTADNLVFSPQVEATPKNVIVKTPYEPYMFAEYSQGESVKSVHPTMNIMTDTNGASVDVEYLRDIDAYIDNLVGAAAVMTLEEV